ncbi:MAG: tyrosine--tRNA ligase [Sedimentisphaerales bacterium]|nr:tyrosine--tRNA ligase [Sedimentisphaerales bacterium]
MANIIETLEQRGLISQVSAPDLAEKLDSKSITVYAGFDPTAKSLHIGNLLQIMLLAQFQRHGHRPIALVGGATAMIGDPSGKSQERNLLDEETIEANLVGIKGQLQQFLDFDGANAALLVNNIDWIGKFSFIEFLRDVGKSFRVGEMMAKESVRKRLNSEAGMSFTEFSYQMLQAYDFYHLCQEYDCTMQTGGDDQWGNITAGIDLTRKLCNRQVFGLTSPLLTTASGQKFGKTEAGAVYLDPEMSSPYDFYQYWIRADDRDAVKLLNSFTFLSSDEIADLAKLVATEPEKREAQKVLAEQVTTMVHGKEQTELVQKAAQVLFGQAIEGLSDATLNSIFADVPSTEMPRAKLNEGLGLLDALCETKLCSSRGEAKKLLKSGGVYINNVRTDQLDMTLSPDSLASETILVLRSGKKKYHLLKFVN